MTTAVDLHAAQALHDHLVRVHLENNVLIGPDPGVRLDYRVGRLVKNHVPEMPWRHRLVYTQAQAYWILANWKLHDLTGDRRYADFAEAASAGLLEKQRSDGAWDYPNPAWKGRILTVEGTWASIALVRSATKASAPGPYLDGAMRWYDYVNRTVGYHRHEDRLAVNYFSNRLTPMVTNNSVTLLRFLSELDQVVDDDVLEVAPALLRFIGFTQLESGELPYSLDVLDAEGRVHLQCYQYNAFEALNLMRYWELRQDPLVEPIINGVLRFLEGAVREDGEARYSCSDSQRTVFYHLAVAASVYRTAASLGFLENHDLADASFERVRSKQLKTGSFGFSSGDYGRFTDNRSYPRYLAMILTHLLTDRS